MALAKKITIFRLAAGDASATVSSDKIEFNSEDQSSSTDFKDDSKEGAYISSIKLVKPEGIGNNQTAEKTDGNIQPLGVTGTFYEVKGWITKIDGNSGNGTNAFLAKLDSWKEDPDQQIKDSWEAGIIGIEDKNDSTNTLLPIKFGAGGTLGGPALIFSYYEKTNDYIKNRADFILRFRRSRGLDT